MKYVSVGIPALYMLATTPIFEAMMMLASCGVFLLVLLLVWLFFFEPDPAPRALVRRWEIEEAQHQRRLRRFQEDGDE